MEKLLKRREEYFATRTDLGEGVVDILLSRTTNDQHVDDICLDHNNYLCLDVQRREKENTIMMSGVFLERSADNVYHQVRERLAKYINMESTYIAQSGYTANINVLQSVANRGTPIYIDQKAHASFWDGIKTSGGKGHIFKHNDMQHLRDLTAKYGPGVVVVDSLYSAVGTFAPLEELDVICAEGGHVFVVDESHSLGLYGTNGAGYCEMMGVQPHYITASLSKAFCLRGGLIGSSARNIKYLAENGMPAIFSSVVEPSDLVKLSDTLDVIKKEDGSRDHLMTISNLIRRHLVGKYGIMETPHPSPIVALIFNREGDTQKFKTHMERNRIFGAVFCFPATPKNASELRLTINTSVTIEQAHCIIAAVKSYGKLCKY